MHYHIFLILILSLSKTSLSLSQNPKPSDCAPKLCGNMNISYPFWIDGSHEPYCGYPTLDVTCENGIAFLANSYNLNYFIKHNYYENSSSLIGNTQLTGSSDNCSVPPFNVSLSLGPFIISDSNKELIFFYDCALANNKAISSDYYPLNCGNNNTFVRLYENYNQSLPKGDLVSNCSFSTVPFWGSNSSVVSNYDSLAKGGFIVEWAVASCTDCKASNGQCGFNTTISNFMCICDDGTFPTSCPIKGTRSHLKKILIGSIISGTVVLILASLIFIIKFKTFTTFLWRYNTQENIELILERYGSLAPKRYKYSELKKITNSFRDKLGEGGFGTVYKGTEQNGDLVAVKFLHNSTSNGEEFINEVISISRTSHINIVNLLGFCIHGTKQALVYEYMPNGSLDRYIYAENPKTTLGWDKLYEIAIGIARGLEYLHSGCNTQIVHFDIKPQNILLDEDFHPKIADFGLAKLCPPKESILSMADMRGTVGFIAPEVFSRSVGVVSTKSDVYSFGMLVLEMVGGRKNVKPSVKNSSQLYFPDWIYEHIAEEGEIQVCDVSEETEEVARKMAMVGFWCTQTIPANRPSMSKVMEMLERSLDELEMPPKPYFNSPPRISVLFSSQSSSGS
ncbi:hypothetical protein LUZ60_009922 [Juncus effusus]|nr:hypothetical protein LUZ60_009922 [Juncus effusus]